MTIWPFILMLATILAVLFGSHFFVYFSLVKIFGIGDFSAKRNLASVFIFLSLSFILASFLAHWNPGFLSRMFYFLSGVWLGMLANLFLVFFGFWMFFWIFRPSLPQRSWATVLVFLALIFTLWGIWNAFNFRVKNVQVKIENLPSDWKGEKAVQISDVHLGHIYREGFMRKVVEAINRENPRAVFITGDLFDGMDGHLETFSSPLDGISAREGVFFVSGNHETYLGTEKSFSILEKTRVKILRNEAVDLSGLQVVGISYLERGEKVDLEKVVREATGDRKDSPRILLWHAPNQTESAKKSGVDLMLSGHTHKGQIFPFGFLTRLIFSGYDYGLKEEGGFFVHTSSGIGTWGPPVRTSSRPEIVVITFL